MVTGRESGDPKKPEKHLQIAKEKKLRNKMGGKIHKFRSAKHKIKQKTRQKGHLAGLVSTVCDSSSWGFKFKPQVLGRDN